VTQADSTPWSFSVQSARIGASDTKVSHLSSGTGNAQGGLDLADGQVWATWQENDPLKDGRFRTRIYAAELSQTGRVKRKIRLWRGLSIGPGSMQVLSFRDETLALFMRGSSNGHGLQVTLKALNARRGFPMAQSLILRIASQLIRTRQLSTSAPEVAEEFEASVGGPR
jgi:hypothetical protein